MVQAVHGLWLNRGAVAHPKRWLSPRPITTYGRVKDTGDVYVYAFSKRGKIKIGMTGRLFERQSELGARLLFCVPVVAQAAKAIETEALRLLGATVGSGEWVWNKPSAAKQAIMMAYESMSRSMHVDPMISAEQARQERVQNYQASEKIPVDLVDQKC